MLRELHISNLAVIEDASVEFQSGLNVFTGATGAGKSLIIGAFELLLGLRAGGAQSAQSLIRNGKDEARVSGVFELTNPQATRELSRILDRPIRTDEPLLITRRLFASGRSSISVNGSPATAGMLKEAGEFLVDIHGQHDQQFLLKPSNQLWILDTFAKTLELRESFEKLYNEIRELKKRKADLEKSSEIRDQRIELYEFQANEIDQARVEKDEFDKVRSLYSRLSNLGQLKKDTGDIYESLYESDDSAYGRLGLASKLLDQIVQLDEKNLASIQSKLTDAVETIKDCSYELNRYADSLELDPEQLDETEKRLDLLNHLIHKYTSVAKNCEDPAAAVLSYRQEIQEKLDELHAQQSDLSQFDSKIVALKQHLEKTGSELTQKRKATAAKLKNLVESQFHELGMEQARFNVEIASLQGDDQQAGPSGFDTIEFLVETNPGMGFQPLRRIASGGEISRIMLALKSILSDAGRVSVLVFDEIDANIGGRLGSVIGRKMHALAAGRNGMSHQILCITHLPQIAAHGDHHLHISKEITQKGKDAQTRTSVRRLDSENRIKELAEMIAGKDLTPTAIAQAKELLEKARK